jgi:hypothetical protein
VSRSAARLAGFFAAANFTRRLNRQAIYFESFQTDAPLE